MKNKGLKIPDDAHIFRMTDDCGIFQHGRYGVPDPSKGYTSDDNARALIMAVLLFEATRKQEYLELAVRYLSFLLYAQNGAWFRNFMSYDRRFAEDRGSQDCFGRCLWAAGFTASRPGLPAGIRGAAEFLLQQTIPGCGELTYLRSKAYAILGLSHLRDFKSRGMLSKLASDLADAYGRNAGKSRDGHNADTGWKWFEESINYCNAVLPRAMFAAYETAVDKGAEDDKANGERYLKIGLESLDFLLSVTFAGGFFRPVGCKGWFPKGKMPAEFDEQPVEACGTLLACLKAYDLTGNEMYRDCAKQCLEWYTGRNSLGVSLIDPETGGCMDGLTPDGPNRNQGAESLISWMTASLVWAGKIDI